jgi:hypothetical protein
MSKSNAFENDLLKLIFNATAIANLADNAASSPLTNLYVSLHTADPGEAGKPVHQRDRVHQLCPRSCCPYVWRLDGYR